MRTSTLESADKFAVVDPELRVHGILGARGGRLRDATDHYGAWDNRVGPYGWGRATKLILD